MVIDLDPWLNLSNWVKQPKEEGVEVIDKCFLGKAVMSKSPKTIRNVTPRKKSTLPSRYKEFIIDKPVGYCPKCSVYVKETDEGVVCVPCQAYWHYDCVGVTEAELTEKWDGIDFLCPKHRSIKATQVSKLFIAENTKCLDDNNEMRIDMRINNFALNQQAKIKDKLSKMNTEFKISPKDNKRQYYFQMSTPTYHLFIENIVRFGKEIGITVKNNDVDLKGDSLQTQFILDIKTTDGANVPISLTGYHTKNSMMIQLMGNKTEDKVNHLSYFVNTILVSVVGKLEKSKEHEQAKKLLKDLLQEAHDGGQNELRYKEPPEDISFTNEANQKIVGMEMRSKVTEDEETSSKQTSQTNWFDEENVMEKTEHKTDKTETEMTVETTDATVPEEKMELIDKIRLRLDEESKEKKKMIKEVEQLRKKVKEADGKDKACRELREKLEKMTKLRDQMSAAVQTLKQNKEVLQGQQETYLATIKSKEDTIQSYLSIMNNYDAKIIEKDETIKNMEGELKEKVIGIETHRDIAYKLMDQSTSDETEESDSQENKKELEKVYKRLRAEEEKSKKLEEDIIKQNNEMKEMHEKILKTSREAKENEERIIRQLSSENEESNKLGKKESKQLKEALNASEQRNAEIGKKVKDLEDQLTTKQMQEIVRNVTKTDQSTYTEGFDLPDDANNTIAELNKIIKDRDLQIKELKENNDFVENQLKEERNETKELKKAAGDLKKELELTKKKIESDSAAQKEAIKEREQCINSYNSSRKEVAQLLYLNDQLKINMEQLEKRVKETGNGQQTDGASDTENQPYNVSNNLHPSSEVNEVNVDRPPNDDDREVNGMQTDDGELNRAMMRELCFREIREEGSCAKGRDCYFSHSIPEEVKRNKTTALNMVGQQLICINEFNKKGSCFKGSGCRFNHEITDAQRNDPALIQIMKNKQTRMQKKNNSLSNSHEKPLCAYEFHQKECPWGRNCKFNHVITEDQKQDERLRENLFLKMNQLNRRSNQGAREIRRNDDINVPREALKKMVSILDGTYNENANEEHHQDGSKSREVKIPGDMVQKMISMLDGSSHYRF